VDLRISVCYDLANTTEVIVALGEWCMNRFDILSRRILPFALLYFVVLFPFAYVSAPIQADDAWIGQQVNSLLDTGEIRSGLFFDFPPLDGNIVVYHKLLVWSGAAVCSILGWGLLQLRVVNVFGAILTMVLIYSIPLPSNGRRYTAAAIVVLIFTPLFWNMQLIFRPETLIMLFGYGSFLSLMYARHRGSVLLCGLSGALSGLAGLAHPIGLAFCAAGCVVLLSERRVACAFVCLAAGLIVFAPYVSGWFTDRELFMDQLMKNDMMLARPFDNWWQPLLNIVEEHQRLFRKAEVIGVSTLLILSLIRMRRADWRANRPLLLYTGTVMLLIAVPPFPKMTQYMLPEIPLIALIVAKAWSNQPDIDSGWRKGLSRLTMVWTALFMIYGAGAFAYAAFTKVGPQLSTNERFASGIEDKSMVLAPVDFVFPDDDRLKIVSYYGAKRAVAGERDSYKLEDYAVALGADYILLSKREFREWNIELQDITGQFSRYHLVLADKDQTQYLLEATSDNSP
jgi:4-amino-4-deoxy-L-arabinose transferase-like glycosyltransferase